MKRFWSVMPSARRKKPPQRFLIGDRIYIARVGFVTIVEFVMPGGAPERVAAAERLKSAGGDPDTNRLVASLLSDDSLRRLEERSVPGPLLWAEQELQPDDSEAMTPVPPRAVQVQAQIDMFGGAA